MNLISIVIPLFNVEEYLERCINSVLKQTYTKIEIILVNDGSTDKCGIICDEFASKDARIIVIHKLNGGLSDARNEGLKKATGAYVFYLDSDDYIALNCIELLYKASQEYTAEVVQANFYYNYPKYLLYNNTLKGIDKLYDQDRAMFALLAQKTIKNFAWGKLIRIDIAKKYPFIKGKYFEDSFWKFHIILSCTNYVALAKPMVFYTQRLESISGEFSMRNLHQLAGEAERLDYLIKNHKKYVPEALSLFHKNLRQHSALVKNLNINNQIIYRKEIQNYKVRYDLEQQSLVFYNIWNYIIYSKMGQILTRIKNRFTSTGKWVKIKHNNTKDMYL